MLPTVWRSCHWALYHYKACKSVTRYLGHSYLLTDCENDYITNDTWNIPETVIGTLLKNDKRGTILQHFTFTFGKGLLIKGFISYFDWHCLNIQRLSYYASVASLFHRIKCSCLFFLMEFIASETTHAVNSVLQLRDLVPNSLMHV